MDGCSLSDEWEGEWSSSSSSERHIEVVGNVQVNEERSGDVDQSNDIASSREGKQKRKYCFLTRDANPRVMSAMRKRWKNEQSAYSDSEIEAIECCKARKCFSVVCCHHLKEKMSIFIKMTRPARRLQLFDMLASDGRFYFDGKQVCATFLNQAFKFSRDMQSSVKKEFQRKFRGAERQHRSDMGLENPRCPVSTTHQLGRNASARDSIITFLERLAERTSDKMPDSPEVHLPFFRKKDVYEFFMKEYSMVYEGVPPTKAYFATIWKTFCTNIKVRKVRRFAKCSLCEQLEVALKDATISHLPYDKIKEKRRNHLESVSRERREYYRKKEKAVLEPLNYCSIIVDGADQSAFGLPHFVTSTKDVRGRALRVRLIGVLEHQRPHVLHLYTMTEEHETGANHIIEVIHRFIHSRRNRAGLPSVFYVQVDNCTRENKNRYFFSYLENLVMLNIFKQVSVSFLPVGHTHEDIDQAFSRTAERLRSNNAISLEDLHEELRKSWSGNVNVTHLQSIVNWSGMCVAQKVLRKVVPFSQYRYFSFLCDGQTTNAEIQRSTICNVKVNCTDPWSRISGFLRSLPNLAHIPATNVTGPEGKTEVTKRLESEESRINDPVKMDALFRLRDHVFRSRTERCHWNLENCLEGEEGRNVCEIVEEEEMEIRVNTESEGISKDVLFGAKSMEGNGERRNRYAYTLNSFVAVKAGADRNEKDLFWIGKVVNVSRTENIFDKINVHWYSQASAGDCYSARYFPCYTKGKGKERDQPWRDVITTDAVYLNFEKLTKVRTLPVAVQKQLRAVLTTELDRSKS